MRLDQHWGKPVFRCPSYFLVAFDGWRGFSWQVTYSLHGIAIDAVLLVHVFNVFFEYQKHVLIGYHILSPYCFLIVSICFFPYPVHFISISETCGDNEEAIQKATAGSVFRQTVHEVHSARFIPHGSFHTVHSTMVTAPLH